MALYDNTDASSIEAYSKLAIGKSIINLFDGGKEPHDYDAFNKELNSGSNKGSIGQIVEKYYFGIKNNSDQLPDFPEAGVELKVTPYLIGKKNLISAKERLIITIINYIEIVEEEFECSHLFSKIKKILLMEYLHIFDKPKADYVIDYAGIFEIPIADLKIIKEDFEKIVNKIKDGKAHELSEADTLYLGAAPKGADSNSLRVQPYSEEMAMQRAFCLKQSYMTYVLRNYIFPDGPVTDKESGSKKKKEKIEAIIPKSGVTQTFEQYITSKILLHKGKTTNQLAKEFDVNCKDNKNFASYLSFRMLGIKNNKAEEFEKANIAVKTIRLESDNTIEQCMSFHNFKFTEVVNETEWEESELYKLWGETKYLFIIFKTDDPKDMDNDKKTFYLYDCQLWNMPKSDLDIHAQKMWNELKNVIKSGIKTYKNGERTLNNLPKKVDNKVCHVRPKGAKATSVYPLPNGSTFTKQCYWLNNDYIESQLNCLK